MTADRGAAIDELIRAVYPELRGMAARLLRGERDGHTLQRTALVHEAFIRLFGRCPDETSTAREFLALAGRQMRHILIDYARKHRSLKAGGGLLRVELFDSQLAVARDVDSLLSLNQALDRLGEFDSRAHAVVELKFFGGFTNAETAEILEVSIATVEENWQFARSWLYGALTQEGVPGSAFDP